MVRRLMLVVGMAALAQPVAAQQLKVESGPMSITFTGRMQFQFNSTSVGEDEVGAAAVPAATTFEVRRLRLAAELEIADWIRGMIEPDFAMGKLQVRQAWMDLAFSDELAFRAGQWKKPFSLIQLTSATRTPMIERAVRIRGLTDEVKATVPAAGVTSFKGTPLLGEQQYLLETLGYDAYDMGAAVHGKLGRLGYEAGVFNGTGSDKQDENAGKSFAGRATYALPMAKPLTFGLGVSRRDFVHTVSNVAVTQNGTALEADLEWGAYRKPGVWLQAEFSQGDNLVAGNFRGAQAVGTYYVATGATRVEGVEPIFRASWGDPNTSLDDDAGLLLTPGINLHFLGRNKLMFNWDLYLPQAESLSKEHAFRAQAQVAF